MENLSVYLKRFTQLLSGKEDEKIIFHTIVQELSPAKVPVEAVSISNGVAYVSGNNSLKNFFFMNKKEILKRCNEQGLALTDLR